MATLPKITTTTTAPEHFALSAVPIGNQCVISDFMGPMITEPMRRRLAELGLRPGIVVLVTQKTANGGRVLKVGGTRYAVDGLTAKSVHVTATQ